MRGEGFSIPQRGHDRREESSQATTPAVRAASPPNIAKVTSPEASESSNATVNPTLPRAASTSALQTATAVERTARGRWLSLSRNSFTLASVDCAAAGGAGTPPG